FDHQKFLHGLIIVRAVAFVVSLG
ncbi:MAG: hypothetical protein RJB17_1708, partial [Pseudomonadota bacterium]